MLLQEYQGIGEKHPQPVAQMGRNPPAETPVMLVKAVPFISDQLRMVPKMCYTITMYTASFIQWQEEIFIVTEMFRKALLRMYNQTKKLAWTVYRKLKTCMLIMESVIMSKQNGVI